MNELALFAGAGGGILGGKLLGWRTVCAVEWLPYAIAVLCQRQNDEILSPFPVWDDVQTFDGRPWRGIVDVVSGGFPCQDISIAGNGAGLAGERSGLWREMARIIGEVRPRFVLVENSPMLTLRGLGTVLGDLAAMGFDAEWGVLGANAIGANHKRERIWILANTNTQPSRCELHDGDSNQMGRSSEAGLFELCGSPRRKSRRATHAAWATEPALGRVAHGVANRVDRLKALGNGQVPGVVAAAWRILTHNAQVSGPAPLLAQVRSTDVLGG